MRSIFRNLLLKLSLVFTILSLFSFSGSVSDLAKALYSESNNSLEKIYLQIDKTYYNAGEDLWYKIYLVDGNTHRTEALSQIVYCDLIDPADKIVVTKTIKIEDGCGEGDFKLTEDLIKGEYTVRAYTNYMRNFDDAFLFRKKVFMNSLGSNKIANQDTTIEKSVEGNEDLAKVSLKPDLQFFPEGGYMISGLLNHIAFKAVGTDGKGIDISGAIVDSAGEQLAEFKTLKFGMGMLNFFPKEMQSYKANITYNNAVYSYDLPASLDRGVVMQIIEKSNLYSVIIRSSLSNGVKDFKFISRQRNKVLQSSINVRTSDGAVISVPKNILEKGIVQFTLCDNNGTPLCERLVFVETNDSEPAVNISSKKREYGKRELVELEISSDQAIPQNLNANMSISVTDTLVSGTDNYGLDIKSYLLLKSDLRGEIEYPGYYFYSNVPERKRVLDLLMMTQGWRQFVLNDTLNDNGSNFKYACETGIRFEGHVKRFNEEGNPAKAVVSLIYSNKQEDVYNETTTDDQGHFVFEGFDFMDSTSVIIQAKSRSREKSKREDIKKPNKNFYIDMDSLPAPKVSVHKTSTNQSNDIFNETYPSNLLTDGEVDNSFQTQKGNILIKEVIVTEKKIDRYSEKRSMYLKPSHSLDFEGIRDWGYPNVLWALNGRIPAVSFDGSSFTVSGGRSSISNNSGPLFLLDGIPISMDAILSIPVTQIDFVDVLRKGSFEASIYGPEGVNGVVAVYLLSASDILNSKTETDKKCIVNFVHPGYSKARKFYEPVYTTGNQEQNEPDNRSTLYWNPTVTFDKQDKIKVSFYSADVPTKYRVILEGISSEGEAITSEVFFDVK